MEKKMNPQRVTWKCSACEDVVISYSHKRHDMNFCKCGETAVDLEEWYSRIVGKMPIFISTEEKFKNKWTKIIRTQLVDWRNGITPRQDALDYFKSKGYLRTPIEGDEYVTVYEIEYPITEMGEMMEDLKENYDIMVRDYILAIDTKGYRFRQR